MITRAHLLKTAEEHELLPTTIEKDYALGWILYGISQHEVASNWVFKGGTCLRKCFFETYRFSEDLDFTIRDGEPYEFEEIQKTIHEIVAWVESESGIVFPNDGICIDQYDNPRGNKSFQIKTSFVGPLQMGRKSVQRVKFDLTQDEVLVDPPVRREIYHPYGDAIYPSLQALCYTVNEILAEKGRALYERQGRARDVFDVVHISRAFRESVNVKTAVRVLNQKFAFKGLPDPTVELILGRIDEGVLEANWVHQLAHQLPILPRVAEFLEGLFEALVWWIEPSQALPVPESISNVEGEGIAPRVLYPRSASAAGLIRDGEVITGSLESRLGSAMSKIVYAARNQLCVRLTYSGVTRIVEPYSLRYPRTGKTLLYVWEQQRGTRETNQVKALSLFQISDVCITTESYRPRYSIEL